jgi:hypothetical protein
MSIESKIRAPSARLPVRRRSRRDRRVRLILDKGIIDSTGILEIVMFLEEQFGIKITDSEMPPENLDSIANIIFITSRVAVN